MMVIRIDEGEASSGSRPPGDGDGGSLDDFLWTARMCGEALGMLLRCQGVPFQDDLRVQIADRVRLASPSWGLPSSAVEAGIRNYIDGVEVGLLDPERHDR